VNKKAFSAVVLLMCLTVMASAALGQQQRRTRRSGGLDNLSLPSTGASIASSSWREFAPDGAGFSVMMPGLPEEMTKNMTPGPRSIEMREYRLKADASEYMIGVALNFPSELMQQPGFAAQYYQMLPTVMIKSAEYAGKHYSLVSQRAVSVEDHTGRQFKFDSPDYTCTMRVFLTDKSVYVISVESLKASPSPEGLEKFFSSFTLKEY
jgi:hypothetical protein